MPSIRKTRRALTARTRISYGRFEAVPPGATTALFDLPNSRDDKSAVEQNIAGDSYNALSARPAQLLTT